MAAGVISVDEDGFVLTCNGAAQQMLQQIRIQAQVERRAAMESARQLNLLSRSMAGLPGRKALVYVSDGLSLRPGEALYHAWYNKYLDQPPFLNRYLPLGLGPQNDQCHRNDNGHQ